MTGWFAPAFLFARAIMAGSVRIVVAVIAELRVYGFWRGEECGESGADFTQRERAEVHDRAAQRPRGSSSEK